jgi:hypothetical protein
MEANMSPARRLMWIALLGGAAWVAPERLSGQVQQVDSEPVERSMIFLAGPRRAPLVVRVGQVIQIQPFTYHIRPGFTAVRLKAHLEADRVLDFIGDTATPPPGEGRAARSGFFLVQEHGTTRVELFLVDEKELPIEGYRRVYVVTTEKATEGRQGRP